MTAWLDSIPCPLTVEAVLRSRPNCRRDETWPGLAEPVLECVRDLKVAMLEPDTQGILCGEEPLVWGGWRTKQGDWIVVGRDL